nr:immunoglobulin heavy chain junction region [Mus musculus]
YFCARLWLLPYAMD